MGGVWKRKRYPLHETLVIPYGYVGLRIDKFVMILGL